jgi:hypothetical protein
MYFSPILNMEKSLVMKYGIILKRSIKFDQIERKIETEPLYGININKYEN